MGQRSGENGLTGVSGGGTYTKGVHTDFTGNSPTPLLGIKRKDIFGYHAV